MKTHLKNWHAGILATLAVAALCATAKADFVGGTYTTGTAAPTAWDQIGGLSPFWTSVTNANPGEACRGGAIGQMPPPANGVVVGANYYPEGETIFAPAQRYNLTGMAVLVSGSAPGNNLQMHLFDVTSVIASNNGGITNGSGTTYNSVGDLLGNGNGLTFTNFGAPTGTNQELFALSNGTNGNDADIVIGDGHIYALELWAPQPAPSTLNWWRTGATVSDVDSTGDGFMAGGEFATRVTIATAGNGGSPRSYILALYGTNTTAPISFSTNAAPGMTNYYVDSFPSATYSGGTITNVWTNWFGSAVAYPSGLTWSTSDAAGAGNSGSLRIGADFSAGTQDAVINGFNGINPPLNGLKIARFECDVMFAPGSSLTTNGTVGNYGHLQFGAVTNGSADYFGSIEIPAGNNGWNHVVMPISAATDTNLLSIKDVVIHIDGNWYSGSPLSGTSTLFVDNVKFTGPANSISAPPMMGTNVTTALPALRIFTTDNGGAGTRQNVGTVVTSLGWYDNGSFPYTYSFTITNFPNTNYAGFDFHMFLVPTNYLRTDYGGNPYGNSFVDNDTTNIALVRISPTGSNYMASVVDKIDIAPLFPTNIVASFLTPKAIGTWTLTFTSQTAGTLTGPTGTSTNFTLSASDAAKFANPVVVFFGVIANASGNLGQAVDMSQVNIGGGQVFDQFSSDFSLDTSTWTNAANDKSTIWLTGPAAKLWVNWSTPDIGFGLAETTNVVNSAAWVSPAVYHSHTPPVEALIGSHRWALLETNHIPPGVVNNLFFSVKTPAPAN